MIGHSQKIIAAGLNRNIFIQGLIKPELLSRFESIDL